MLVFVSEAATSLEIVSNSFEHVTLAACTTGFQLDEQKLPLARFSVVEEDLEGWIEQRPFQTHELTESLF